MTWTKQDGQTWEKELKTVSWDVEERVLIAQVFSGQRKLSSDTVIIPFEVLETLLNDNGYRIVQTSEIERFQNGFESLVSENQALENRIAEQTHLRRVAQTEAKSMLHLKDQMERDLSAAVEMINFDTQVIKQKEKELDALRAEVARLKAERDNIIRLASEEIKKLKGNNA